MLAHDAAIVLRTAVILGYAVDGHRTRMSSPDAWWATQPAVIQARWTKLAGTVLAEVMPVGFFLSSPQRERAIARMEQIVDALHERTDRLRRWEVQLDERERRVRAAEGVMVR